MKKFYCDGASEFNQSGWGYWIEEEGKCVEEHFGKCKGTSNEAEWTAVVEASKRIKELDEPVEILSDSQLVIFQLVGRWRIHKEHLKKYLVEAKKNLVNVQWSAKWIPREQNEYADVLSKKSIVGKEIERLMKSSSFPKPSMYRAYLRSKEREFEEREGMSLDFCKEVSYE